MPTERHTFCLLMGRGNIFSIQKFIPFHFTMFIRSFVSFAHSFTPFVNDKERFRNQIVNSE